MVSLQPTENHQNLYKKNHMVNPRDHVISSINRREVVSLEGSRSGLLIGIPTLPHQQISLVKSELLFSPVFLTNVQVFWRPMLDARLYYSILWFLRQASPDRFITGT